MPEKLFGDYRGFASRIANKEFERVSGNLEEAYSTGISILRDAHDRALKRLEGELKEKLSNIRERVASEKATLDLNLRHRIAVEKSTAIDKVVSEAVSLVLSEKGEKWYREYLEAAIKRAVSELPPGEVVVRASPEDKSVVEEIVKEEVSGRSVRVLADGSIRGGIIAETVDGLVRTDYSLELLIRTMESALRSKASRELFGE